MNVVIRVNDEIKEKMIEYYKDKVRDKIISFKQNGYKHIGESLIKTIIQKNNSFRNYFFGISNIYSNKNL